MPIYDTIGRTYAGPRQTEPRIAALIEAALGDARSVVNIGAGTGSYEPAGRAVIALEPSAVMIGQRPAGSAPCVHARAEALPLATGSVDAAMAILTVHHWSDVERGLAEIARVARRRVVLLTWVPDAAAFWLTADYFPQIAADDRETFPDTAALTAMLQRLGGRVSLTPVPIPHDCADGFLCAFWRRPEAYLRAEVRAAMSSFARFDAGPGLDRLQADLESGRWREKYGALLALEALDLGYRVVRWEVGAG